MDIPYLDVDLNGDNFGEDMMKVFGIIRPSWLKEDIVFKVEFLWICTLGKPTGRFETIAVTDLVYSRSVLWLKIFFSVGENFDLAKVLIKSFKSHLFLIGVTAAHAAETPVKYERYIR